MKKEDVINILKYYIVGEQTFLYYEKKMYPTRVNRNDFINLIADDICKLDEPKEEPRITECQDGTPTTNTGSCCSLFGHEYNP